VPRRTIGTRLGHGILAFQINIITVILTDVPLREYNALGLEGKQMMMRNNVSGRVFNCVDILKHTKRKRRIFIVAGFVPFDGAYSNVTGVGAASAVGCPDEGRGGRRLRLRNVRNAAKLGIREMRGKRIASSLRCDEAMRREKIADCGNL
jgi:hypothetical protein